MYVCMYVYKYIVHIYLLCMIKISVKWCTCSVENVITLCKLIGLFFYVTPSSPFCFENSKNTINELAGPVLETIFLVNIFQWSKNMKWIGGAETIVVAFRQYMHLEHSYPPQQ